jgi:hypothetical protein
MSENKLEQLPLSLTDYLLSHIVQECAEIIVRITKAQHFGLDEKEPGQDFTNRERISHEFCDLLALCEVARDHQILADFARGVTDARIEAKKQKAERFREYSIQLGRLHQ